MRQELTFETKQISEMMSQGFISLTQEMRRLSLAQSPLSPSNEENIRHLEQEIQDKVAPLVDHPFDRPSSTVNFSDIEY